MAYEDEPVLGVPGSSGGVLGSGSRRRQIAAARQRPAEPILRPDEIEEEPDFTGPVGKYQRMSTRMPTGKGAEEWHHGDLRVDTDVMKRDEKFFPKVIANIKGYPNLTEKEKSGKDEKVAQRFQKHGEANLHFLNELLHPEVREESRHWYPGGNRIISERANHFSVPMHSATSAYSTQSPQKDWHINVSLGDRLLHTIFRRGNERASQKMLDIANSVWSPKPGREPPKSERSAEIRARLDAKNEDLLRWLDETKGQTLNQHLVDLHDKLRSGNFSNQDLERLGAWVRMFDEANHDPRYAIIHPRGHYLDFFTNVDKTHGRRAWGSALEAGNAVAAAILGGNRTLIRPLLGERHKVPSFDSNLGDPWHSAGDVTGDTHAAAGFLLSPLPATHRRVAEMFSGPPRSASHGLNGWYGILNDAIREASAHYGWRPSEGQGVFWGGARGIFPGDWAKSEDIQNAVEKMWSERGNRPIRKIQEQIYNHMRDLANDRAKRLKRPQETWEPGGIGLPEWYGVHQRPGMRWDFFTKG